MKSTVKVLLALALVVIAASGAWAQAAGNWQKIHGQVQSIQGDQLSLKADDGRMVNVEMSQVSQSVRGAMTPGLGVTVTGFPGNRADRFTARFIEQDNAGPAAAVAATDGNAVIARIVPVVPQFLASGEFQGRAAGFQGNRTAAHRFVSQLYHGFFSRPPGEQDQNYWANHLLQTGNPQETVEAFLKSPEYMSLNKNETQVITDLYQGVFGRTPTSEEIRGWQQRIAQK